VNIADVYESAQGWHDADSAREEWLDAPFEDPQLEALLDVARVQCLTYAPGEFTASFVPPRYRMAQLLQARNLWNASKQDPGGEMGGEGFAVRVFPMDWTVKNLLRPKSGVPVMF
jgi:hypothetical protein